MNTSKKIGTFGTLSDGNYWNIYDVHTKQTSGLRQVKLRDNEKLFYIDSESIIANNGKKQLVKINTVKNLIYLPKKVKNRHIIFEKEGNKINNLVIGKKMFANGGSIGGKSDEELIDEIKNDDVYKRVIKDSLGGIMYDVSNLGKYYSSKILSLWNEIKYKDIAGGIMEGAMKFLEENQEKLDEESEFETKVEDEIISFSKEALMFVPKHQLGIIKKHKEAYQDGIKRINKAVEELPVTYGTDGVKDKTIYLHYFYGNLDWYIVEKDKGQSEEDETKAGFEYGKQYQAFGYADLGYGAELGYISIEEIINNGKIELDFYFEPKKWSEVNNEDVEESEFSTKVSEAVVKDDIEETPIKATENKLDNLSYFKGINYIYKNQFELNKAIEVFLDTKNEDYIFSDDEKSFIYKFEGYGGLEKEGGKGKGLLSEYYTPTILIKKMWGLAYKYGFTTGNVLEPSAGIGRVLDYLSPQDTATAYEINSYSARICKILHPQVEVFLKPFEEYFYDRNTFKPNFGVEYDLVIGNPPYGKNTSKRYHAENKRMKGGIAQYEHYFILRGLDVLKSNGLLIYVVPSNLFYRGYEKVKELISERAELVDAYLLPDKTFERTKVPTSLIVLKKK